ncbi:acyl carrier protein [Cellvibrio sp. PSBB006]|uniref:acyl carrier protein n=1 Tax=Cellvibrio sp. PSBB006 TaxID=1987723 RepID=UPI000B3BA621|nr:acyl carrier protein [Cellvibrio sp. PSBB006]ARU30020.1 acyl carrier protein [Cellvibrio sp. PSBB006]
MYAEKVREILAKHSRLDVDVNNLKEDDDLYDLGLTSLTTVNIMLAIEDAFDIEFPDSKLNRKTFNSIESLVDVIEELVD